MFSGQVMMQNSNKEGRESYNKMLEYFFFCRNKNAYHSFMQEKKRDNTLNFLFFSCK